MLGSWREGLTCVFFRRANNQHPSLSSDALGAAAMICPRDSIVESTVMLGAMKLAAYRKRDGWHRLALRIGHRSGVKLSEVDPSASEAAGNEATAGGER